MKKNKTGLGSVHITKNDFFLIIAAFISYTGMYAVRKSFLAGQYSFYDMSGFDYKTILVISQVLGYMTSKFIGIKVVSESTPEKRTTILISLVSFGLIMLLAFAYLPLNMKPIALFFNGLPLGMVFGLVLAQLEGRKNTELLVAGLSVTFIFSTGLIKTTGVWLMQDFAIDEFMMPFLTGLMFFPFFILAAYLLKICAPPSSDDIALRTVRIPMGIDKRKDFLKKHGFTFGILVFIYVLLTAVRDFRDNFTVEFWKELGHGNEPHFITLTEIPIAIIVLIIASLGILFHSNSKAFKWGLYATLFGSSILLLSTFLFNHELISPIYWMILSGLGVYLPYILFHCLIFERFIALLKYKGTIGFLFYVADALGYLVSVTVLVSKEVFEYKHSWLRFFSQLNMFASLGIIAMTIIILILTNNQKTIQTNPIKI